MSQFVPSITDTLTDGVGNTPMIRIGTHNYSKCLLKKKNQILKYYYKPITRFFYF